MDSPPKGPRDKRRAVDAASTRTPPPPCHPTLMMAFKVSFNASGSSDAREKRRRVQRPACPAQLRHGWEGRPVPQVRRSRGLFDLSTSQLIPFLRRPVKARSTLSYCTAQTNNRARGVNILCTPLS
jgi:hypothetical protein